MNSRRPQKMLALSLMLTLFSACATVSVETKERLYDQQLVGEWEETKGRSSGWMDISCKGELKVKTEGDRLDNAVITKVEKGRFSSTPNPLNRNFTFKVLRDGTSGHETQVVTVRSVPESNILKITQVFSTLIGNDDTLVFKKIKNHKCL